MNYLAHLFLSPSYEQVQVGNLMGDFIKGNKVNSLPQAVRSGVILHRAIDKFTDNHSSVKALKPLLSIKRRRFHGIISDIAFDHFLAKHWLNYTNEPLNEFAARSYQTLAAHKHVMPTEMSNMVDRMATDNWLVHYAKPESIGRAIDGVSRRIRFDNSLLGGGEEVLDVYDKYQDVFEHFFPELVNYVQKQILQIE